MEGDASKLDSAALHACMLSQEHAEKVEPVNLVLDLQEGDYIIARYDNICYIGKVLNVDADDKDVQVSFMVKSDVKGATRYKWPNPSDEIWIPQSA